MSYLIQTRSGNKGPFHTDQILTLVKKGKLPETARVLDDDTGDRVPVYALGEHPAEKPSKKKPQTPPAPHGKHRPAVAPKARTPRGPSHAPEDSAVRKARRAPQGEPAKLPSLKNHIVAVIVVPLITLGMYAAALDAQQGIEHAYHGRHAASKQALAAISEAVGPIGVVALGGVALAIALTLLILRIRRRRALRLEAAAAAPRSRARASREPAPSGR